MTRRRRPIEVTLSPAAHERLSLLALHFGISRSQVLESLILEMLIGGHTMNWNALQDYLARRNIRRFFLKFEREKWHLFREDADGTVEFGNDDTIEGLVTSFDRKTDRPEEGT